VSELFEDLDQQRAAGQERDAETLVRHVLDLIENAKQMPLSASVLISKEEVAELLQDALQRMPDELRQARWLLKEREDFIAEKSREADVLLEEVRVQAERMVQRTEIVRQANHVAQRILDDANEEARRLRHEVEDYADQKLASFEIVLDRTMKTVRAGREKLQVSPIPPVEIGEQGDTSLAPSPSSVRPSGVRPAGEPGALGAPDSPSAGVGAVEDPDGFFDQDLD
jgi:vacuolar-type H+-ATPase subunit H